MILLIEVADCSKTSWFFFGDHLHTKAWSCSGLQATMLLSTGLPVLQVRLSYILITVLAAGLLFHSTKPYHPRRTFVADTGRVVDGEMPPEEEYLERLVETYGLANKTKWQAWKIEVSEQRLDDDFVTDVHAKFQPYWDASKVIDLDDPNPSDLKAANRIKLPVPQDATRDRSNGAPFLFGISTTYERIADGEWAILRAWRRWLTKSHKTTNGASLVLMLDDATDGQLDEIDKLLRSRGIEAYLTSTDEPTSKARRYYELIRVMKTYGATLAASGHEKKWFGLVEDTVFFPSLSYLEERLSAYDADEGHYIGLPSERSDWHHDGSTVTTYGGGAIMLTRKAMSIIPKIPCLDTDSSAPSFRAQKWDVLLQGCLRQYAGMDMRVIPSFYSPRDANDQLQLIGHETGIRPLLLHDYQSRHRLDVGMAHLVANICGDDCFMHRYLFHDNWVVINGVSISHHPDGLVSHYEHHRHHHVRHPGEEEADMFVSPRMTAISEQIIMDESEIEQEPLTWTGRRELWNLLDSAVAADGSVWQAYLRRKPGRLSYRSEDAESEDDMDSLIVLTWEDGKQR